MTASRPTPLHDSYEGLQARARAAIYNGDHEGAIDVYRRLVGKLDRLSERILSRRPELRGLEVAARLELAELLRMEGRYAEAIEAKEPLLERDPDRAPAWRRELAVLRIAKGEVETGLAELEALAKAEPEHTEGWLIFGREARMEGRLGESQTALDRALAVAAQDTPDARAAVHYERFLLFRDEGRLDDAVAEWEQAVGSDDELLDTVHQVHSALTASGRYSEALRYVARDENPLSAGFQRGLVAQLTGRQAQAKQEWHAVAKLNPAEYDRGHEQWTEAVLRLGDPDPALKQLQLLLTRFTSPRLVVLAGIAWAMRGDSELASSLFQRAINLQRYSRPPRQKLDSADWRLLDSLVADQEHKAILKPYFAVVETLWA